jgi:hypothetical protein
MGPPFAGAAGYLGIPVGELMKELRSGKTLAAIAKAKGKSVSGLESALIAPIRTHLDQAVEDGHLTKAQEQRILGMLTKGIDEFVTHGFHIRASGSITAPAPAAFGL